MTARSSDGAAGESSDRRRPSRPSRTAALRSETEIGRLERVASGLLGAALLVSGLRRRSLGGALLALLGSWLSYRAVSGSPGFGGAFESAGGVNAGGTSASSPTDESGDDSTGSTSGLPTVSRSVTVGRSAPELSELLHDPEQLDRVAGEFVEVEAGDGDEYEDENGDRYRWRLRGPYDRGPTWETRLIESPDERLRWEPTDGAVLFDQWTVELRPAPGDRGTEVTLRVGFDPPGGGVGRAVLRRFDVVPRAFAGTALDRFKSLAETGEIPSLEGNTSARGRGDLA